MILGNLEKRIKEVELTLRTLRDAIMETPEPEVSPGPVPHDPVEEALECSS